MRSFWLIVALPSRQIQAHRLNTIVCGLVFGLLGFFALRTTITVSFGQVLGSLRRTAKLSQEELADRSNLHRTYISQLERGLKSPSLKAIAAIAKALNIAPHALVRAAEEKKN